MIQEHWLSCILLNYGGRSIDYQPSMSFSLNSTLGFFSLSVLLVIPDRYEFSVAYFAETIFLHVVHSRCPC
jgi:hypothetical protein